MHLRCVDIIEKNWLTHMPLVIRESTAVDYVAQIRTQTISLQHCLVVQASCCVGHACTPSINFHRPFRRLAGTPMLPHFLLADEAAGIDVDPYCCKQAQRHTLHMKESQQSAGLYVGFLVLYLSQNGYGFFI